MSRMFTRRDVLASLAAVAAMQVAQSGLAAPPRKLRTHVGYTGITWRNDQVDLAIQSVSSLGFYGFETFGDVLSHWQSKGGLEAVLEKNRLPLISGYCTMNLTEPSRKADEIARAKNWCKLIKQCNGRIFVVGPNPVDRKTYDFPANRTTIVSALNELALVVEQEGLTPVLHQHTGTCIESRDETYAVLESVDTRHLKFGPDVGQLTKGGQDAVKVVKDFLPIVQHMHLKDYNGKDERLAGYCPLGQGTVDVRAILKMMEGRKISGMVMVELDNDSRTPSPTPPATLARESRDYLRTIGVEFRA
ncbi:MAG: TIM barrel protein [Acidobacteria bacterium]|nr:TIM barrel protein [Acidobacteriota bacterium]